MKTVTYRLTGNSLSSTIDINAFKMHKNLLIQVFCGQGRGVLQEVISELGTLFPKAVCIGATTDGEIDGKNIHTNETILALSTFEKTQIQSAYVDNGNSFRDGEEIAKTLIKEDTKLLLVFTDGTTSNGEDFLKGIESINNQVIVAGGMAGDNAQFIQTYISEADVILSQGAVAVSLSSEHLQVHNAYSFNWSPIGVEHRIDKVENNRVYSIGGMSAVAFYAKYLGEAVADALPSTGIEFPLIVKKSGLEIARAVLAKHDDGSLSFAGNLKNGDKIKLGFGNAEMIINSPTTALDVLCHAPVESFFIYSCMARRRYMPDFIQVEIEPFSRLATVVGFFTYAEFYHHDGHNELFNQTLTAVALSESKKEQDIDCCEEIRIQGKESEYAMTIQALTHLVQQSTADLEAQATTLEREKLFSQKLLSNQKVFMRHAIHETMTPLSIIMNNIELSALKLGKNNYLSNIEVAMKNIFTIYDDLSYLVKRNQRSYPKYPIDFVDYLRSRIEFFTEVATQSNLSFSLKKNREVIEVLFNETKLQRIIDNNLTNAIKYTLEGEVIEVSLEGTDTFCKLSFSSHSSHIQQPDKVFDAYYREDEEQEGFGLGLNLVKEICDEEEVEVTLTSNQAFTTFTYLFKRGL